MHRTGFNDGDLGSTPAVSSVQLPTFFIITKTIPENGVTGSCGDNEKSPEHIKRLVTLSPAISI